MIALKGGVPVRNVRENPWPVWPERDDEDSRRLAKVVESGVWSYNGPMEQEFLERWKDFVGVPYAVAAVNGTVTLQLALEALDIGWGDEVILPGLTWQATAAVVVDVNAVPVLVDVEPDTWCLDPKAVEAAITSRTKAIITVHLYGNMADMDALNDIAKRHNLALIEDAAHQHGSSWRGARAGAIGTIGSFSLQLSKVLTAGEGGLLTVRDKDLWVRLDALRNCGRRPEGFTDETDKGGGEYGSEGDLIQSGNYRITEFQAAMLLGGLERLPAQVERRAKNARDLDRLVESVPGLAPMRVDPRQTERSYFNYAFRYDSNTFGGGGIPVETFRAALTAELGISFEACYEPLNNCVLYRPHTKRRYRISEDHWRAIDPSRFSLPVCEAAFRDHSVTVHHKALLGGEQELNDIEEAILRIQAAADTLRKTG